jgi:hypothetical protein
MKMALMMEAARTSATSVNFYQTARCNNPKDRHLHTRRRENLKSHLVNLYGEATLIALMMEAASTSVTWANFYHTTRRINPENSHLHYLVFVSIGSKHQFLIWFTSV